MIQSLSKPCKKCCAVKPIDEFYRHEGMRDGRLNKCIECAKKDARLNRRKNIEYYRAYDRARGVRQSHSDILNYRKKNPDKYKARNAVNNAIRDGRLVRKPCEQCGAKKTQAHHEDYSQPLSVRWLCLSCHWEQHTAH